MSSKRKPRLWYAGPCSTVLTTTRANPTLAGYNRHGAPEDEGAGGRAVPRTKGPEGEQSPTLQRLERHALHGERRDVVLELVEADARDVAAACASSDIAEAGVRAVGEANGVGGMIRTDGGPVALEVSTMYGNMFAIQRIVRLVR